MSNLQNKLHQALRATAVMLAAATLMSGAITAQPANADKTTATENAKAPKGKILFVAMTGIDDIQTLNGSLKHATGIKKSGMLEDVAWLSYGRGVQAMAGNMKAVPESLTETAKKAKEAGVHLMVCKNALQGMGVPEDSLDPEVEIVENGALTLAKYVSEGYTVISY